MEPARAILRASGSGNDARAEELADSLYAELYGIRSASGERRKSLFEYFHGRSKLSTWLRAVLAQRHVDLLRADRGTISLDSAPDGKEDRPPLELAQRTDPAPDDPDRAKYLALLDRALAEPSPPWRRATVCSWPAITWTNSRWRKSDAHWASMNRRCRGSSTARGVRLRETVTDALRRGTAAVDGHGGDPGLDESQVELAFEYALEDWPFDLSRALSKAETAVDPSQKSSQKSGKPMQDSNTGSF